MPKPGHRELRHIGTTRAVYDDLDLSGGRQKKYAITDWKNGTARARQKLEGEEKDKV